MITDTTTNHSSSSTQHPYLDYTPFASPRFDTNSYANAILSGETYDPDTSASASGGPLSSSPSKSKPLTESNFPTKIAKDGSATNTNTTTNTTIAKGDISSALTKLNRGISDVTSQLRQEIDNHHPLLLSHLSNSSHLSSQLSCIRSSLTSLDTSLSRLQGKIHDPYEEIEERVRRLEKIRACSEVLRRAGRFILLAKRLETQMAVIRGGDGGGDDGSQFEQSGKGTAAAAAGSGQAISNTGMVRSNSGTTILGGTGDGEGNERERELAKAGLTIAEIDTLLDDSSTLLNPSSSSSSSSIPLKSLTFVSDLLPLIQTQKDAVISEMEVMVVEGLAKLDQPLLSSSLQTAYNLRLLPRLVSNLLADLNDAVQARIAKVFDVNSIAREVAQREQPSSGPTTISTSSAASIFTHRSKPKTEVGPTNQNMHIWQQVIWNRLDILMDDIAQCCIKVYILEKILKLKSDPASDSLDFLSEVMQILEEKPSFTFWTTLATSFDSLTRNGSSVIQQILSQGYPRVLRIFQGFFGKIAVHTNTQYTNDYQSPETVLLLRSVAKYEGTYLSRASSRMSENINGVFSNWPRQAPSESDGFHLARIMSNELDSARFDPLLIKSVANAVSKSLDEVVARVDRGIIKDFSATSLIGPLANSSQVTNAALTSFLYNLIENVRQNLTNFGARAESIMEPSIQSGVNVYTRVLDGLDSAIRRDLGNILARMHKVDFSKPVNPMTMSGGANGNGKMGYVADLEEKLNFLRLELLGRFSIGEKMSEWVKSIVRQTIHAFILHASITRPLGESGRLTLTSHLTELEWSLSSFLTTGQAQGSRNVVRLESVGDEYRALRAFR